MFKKIDYGFATLELTEHYSFVNLKENCNMTLEQSKDMLKDVLNHFGKRKYVIIVDRKEETTIDLKSYKLANPKQVIGIAIVSKAEKIFDQLIKEQRLFKNSFAFFKTVDEAKDWDESFVERYG